MAGDPDQLAKSFETENTGGVLSGFLAEEDHFDRRSLWRLGSWGVVSVGAVVVAVLANQSSIGWRRDQVAAADLVRQSQQIQSVAKESQNETRRLATAIDTLNGDRDRLSTRLTVLEQGLESVTGSIARQTSGTASPQTASPPAAATEPKPVVQNPVSPAVAPPATTAATAVEPVNSNTSAATPATPLMASKSVMAPPDPAAGKLIEPAPPSATGTSAPEVASVSPADNPQPEAAAETPPDLAAVQRTEFAVDVGGARSLEGLRALWRGLVKSNTALAGLRPVIAVKEGHNGLGMQLRLVAGPLGDAAAAARICAALIEGQRPCETTVFDGQRLAIKGDEPSVSIAPAPIKPAAHKRSAAKPVANAEPKKPETSTLSSLFGKHN
ncbi:MAG: hypothetical protein E7813_06660 [Bradyrhizobium sp.]|uniref:hypothetical protein n=1 Tax=Bradyrhizobium sp. TaxID=376 RepID=UPI0011FC4B81|nr:hypothetical protein [Bradyrhizobium sp.]THD70952.1 MAG: hypothetical protein E7813_06660 [Bradyrhizobium sp.]